ncbi:cytidylate kinase family protein [Candidatus Uhrbacteria bacterium]|nr:cytidylate kinase family protein [Candidatus Uhrbacteria bacterium]
MVITISGPAGSGKSTVAGLLAKKLGIPTIDVGKVFREKAEKTGMDITKFSDYRLAHPEIDREIDLDVMDRCLQCPKGCILQGRVSAWMTKRQDIPAIRIWIDASPPVRASRIANREGGDPEKILESVNRRDRNDWKNYRDNYGIDLNDLSVYDIVVPTDDLPIEGVVSFILNELQKYG